MRNQSSLRWLPCLCGLVLLATLPAAGCTPKPGAPASTAAGGPNPLMKPVTADFGQQPDKARQQYMLIIRMRLASIEVPVGTASGSEAIWSYLDEERIKAVRTAALSRNGIRMGVGKAESWPDVARLLGRLTGQQLQEASTLSTPGSPMPVLLKRGEPMQTIFTVADDRTISGRDYPPGDYMLTVCCTLDRQDPTRVLITGLPQVRLARPEPVIENREGSMVLLTRPPVLSLDDATFQLSLAAKDFLVIGPGAESRRQSSAGHQFLVKDKDGVEFETVIVMIPEVFAAPLGKPADGAAGIVAAAKP
jgi:hypothetical protein